MAVEKYDRGSTVSIEIEFKKRTPNVSDDRFDPTVPKITIYDPDGKAVVTDADLVNDATGLFHYLLQTLPSWKIGYYSYKVTATAGSYNDISEFNNKFELV